MGGGIVREFEMDIHTAIVNVNNQHGPAVEHR